MVLDSIILVDGWNSALGLCSDSEKGIWWYGLKKKILLLALVSFAFLFVKPVSAGSADIVTNFTRTAKFDITAGTYAIQNLAQLIWERDTNAPLNNHIRRAVIEFNVSSIPDNAFITGVSLLYSDGQTFAGFGTKMHHFMIEFRYVIDLFNIEVIEIVILHEKMHTVNLTVGYMY